MAIVPATPLANPQFAIPDFATPLAQALGAIQQRRQQTQAADLGEQAFEADDLETRNKALLKLSQLDPRMAQATAAMLGVQDEAERAKNAEQIKQFGDFTTSLYRTDNKAQADALLKAEIRRRVSEGLPYDRLEEMLGMSDAQRRATALTLSVASGQSKGIVEADQARMDALKTEAEARLKRAQTAQTEQQTRIQGEEAARGPAPKDPEGMRKEFTAQTKDFRSVRDAFAKVQTAAANPSAAGDLSLIFNYMKMLDPGSVVREGEFATAQNAAGVSTQVRNAYNRVVSGERLSEDQRADFTNTAGNIYGSQLGILESTEGAYRDLATRAGVNPDDVVIDFRGGISLQPTAAEKPPAEMSDDELMEALSNQQGAQGG